MKKRIVFFVIAIVLILGLVAGCAMRGGGGNVHRAADIREDQATAATDVDVGKTDHSELGQVVAEGPAESAAPLEHEEQVGKDESGESSAVVPGAEDRIPDAELSPQPSSEPSVPASPSPGQPWTTPAPDIPKPVATPTPETPAATPVPHVHNWTPVYVTVHHEAVTEEVKVIDQEYCPAVHDIKYKQIWVCSCGATFDSYAGYEAHTNAFIASGDYEEFSKHGYTFYYDYDTIISDVIVQEEIPEISHYETVVIEPAWDEEVLDHYVCEVCGETKGS